LTFAKNMKTHIVIIIAVLAFLKPLPIKAEEGQKLLEATPRISEIQQLKEEIKRQEIMLQDLTKRLTTLESKDQKEKTFVINLIDGRPVLLGSEVSLKEIKLALSQRAQISNEYPIVIRADKATPYSAVVEILELSKKAGLSNVAFATPKE